MLAGTVGRGESVTFPSFCFSSAARFGGAGSLQRNPPRSLAGLGGSQSVALRENVVVTGPGAATGLRHPPPRLPPHPGVRWGGLGAPWPCGGRGVVAVGTTELRHNRWVPPPAPPSAGSDAPLHEFQTGRFSKPLLGGRVQHRGHLAAPSLSEMGGAVLRSGGAAESSSPPAFGSPPNPPGVGRAGGRGIKFTNWPRRRPAAWAPGTGGQHGPPRPLAHSGASSQQLPQPPNGAGR